MHLPWRSILMSSLAALPAYAQPAPPNMAAAADDPAAMAMMSGMDRMNKAMGAAAMSGDPDRDFVAMMIPHHQGAIDMARVELRYGKDPGMRRLAAQVVAAQNKEIAEMQRWQAAHHPR